MPKRKKRMSPVAATKKKKKQGACLDVRAYLTGRVLGLAVAAGVMAVDAATKLWALNTFGRGQLPIVLHEDIGALVLAFNRGMSFSMLTNQAYAPVLLSVIAIVASAWFIHWLGESKKVLHQVGLGMILGGALGNLVDRLQHGAVVDFLLPLWKAEPWFPAFNVADTCISVGLVLILANWFFDRKKPAKGEK